MTGTDTRRVATAGSRVAYDVKGPLGWSMVVDGKTGPVFDAIVAAEFNSDGTRMVYLGARGGKMVPVVDGKEEPIRANVDGIRFSPDSKRLAYVAMDISKNDVVGRIVLDGVPGRAHQTPILNLDGMLRAAHHDLKTFGLWQPPDLIPLFTGTSAPVFRADGKVLYAGVSARLEEGIWLEGGDKPLFPASSSVMAGPVLNAKGDRVGWVESNDGQWTGFVDGQRGPAAPTVDKRANDVSNLTLSPDGSRMAFVHIAGGGSFRRGLALHALRRVVATGVEGKTYDAANITNLRFSADGGRLAYEVHEAKGFEHPGSKNGSFVVLDGVLGRVYSSVLPGTMRFTDPDTVVYVARLQSVKDGPYRYYRVTQSATATKR